MSLTLDQERNNKLLETMRLEGQTIVNPSNNKKDNIEIQKETLIKTTSVINVKITDNTRFVEVGKMIRLRCIYTGNEQEEFTVKLIGNFMKKTSNEISLNSPLGGAINKKEIGYKGHYIVDNEKTEFEILDIIFSLL